MLTRPKVLIINDNPADVALVEEQLSKDERFTFRVDKATSVEEGLELLRSKEFNVILLDLAIHPYNGLEALTKLNGEVMHTPVIVFTGDEDCSLGHRARPRDESIYL